MNQRPRCTARPTHPHPWEPAARPIRQLATAIAALTLIAGTTAGIAYLIILIGIHAIT